MLLQFVLCLRYVILYVFDALGSTYRSLYFCMVQNALAASLLPFASTWAPHSFLLQPAYLSPSNLAGCSFDPIRHPQPRRRAYPPSTTLCPDSLAPPSVDSPVQDPRALGHKLTGAGSAGSYSRDALGLLSRVPTFASCARAMGSGSTNPSTRYYQSPPTTKDPSMASTPTCNSILHAC